MTCKDCIHCSACMHTRTAALDPYQSRPTNKDTGECSDWFTTDVQEVKHGRWLTYRFCLEVVTCSICRAVYEGGDSFRFCPKCGAKMDLEDDK